MVSTITSIKKRNFKINYRESIYIRIGNKLLTVKWIRQHECNNNPDMKLRKMIFPNYLNMIKYQK